MARRSARGFSLGSPAGRGCSPGSLSVNSVFLIIILLYVIASLPPALARSPCRSPPPPPSPRPRAKTAPAPPALSPPRGRPAPPGTAPAPAPQPGPSPKTAPRPPAPTPPGGRPRPARTGPRHGLRGSTFALLPGENPAEWAAHLDGYLARLRPVDAAELRCVERLAACDWREARLLRLETDTLFAGRGETSEPDPRLGWSRTLLRYAAAIRRDRKEALEQLGMLRASRPRLTSRPAAVDAARFRWLAERAERLAAMPADVTPEPEAQAGAKPEPALSAAAIPPAPANDVTPEPEPRRPLNRAERRRLAALARRTA